MIFEIQILGISAAIQANNRHQSAQVLQLNSSLFLIDCGEGTQEQLVRRKINNNKISKIFISHLHGDHFLGLFGLLSTMSLLGRTKKLEIYGPKGLKEIISTQLKYCQSYFAYPIDFIETKPDKEHLVFENDSIEIKTFPLHHGIDCTGFLFKEKLKSRKITYDTLPANINVTQLKALKAGDDIEINGQIIKNETLTSAPKKSRSYAYCSDTSYHESTAHYVKNVDLLYHESTFLVQHQDKAQATHHSSSIDAAKVAKEANASKLLLGHFSARYSDDSFFETEAQTIFPNAFVAKEGNKYAIPE